jgi:hypothetical protein
MLEGTIAAVSATEWLTVEVHRRHLPDRILRGLETCADASDDRGIKSVCLPRAKGRNATRVGKHLPPGRVEVRHHPATAAPVSGRSTSAEVANRYVALVTRSSRRRVFAVRP